MSEFERQHPIATVTRLATAVKQNLITFIVLFIGAANTGSNIALYSIVGGVVFSFFYGIFSWWQYKFRVVDGELQIISGVFVKKKLYLSKERIQVIDITEGLIQRMFGLVQMNVKTAGSGTEKASISAITREKAIELQNLLRFDEIEKDSVSEQEKESVIERKLEFRELIYAALTSGSFGIIASIMGAISSQLDVFINEENLNYLSTNLPGYTDNVLIIMVVVLFIFFAWVLSFMGVVIQYSDFKIQRKEKELVITRGLFERKQITVPFNRIQAVRIVESFARLPFGRAMIYLESAGFQVDKTKSVIAMPIIKYSDVESFLDEFLDGYRVQDVVVKPPKRALIKYIRRPNYPLLVAVPAFAILASIEFSWLLLLAIPLGYLGWKGYKENGVYIGEKLLVVKERFFARKTVLINKSRVQVAQVKMNPFQLRKDLATYQVTVASGKEGISFNVMDLEREEAERLIKWPVLKSIEY